MSRIPSVLLVAVLIASCATPAVAQAPRPERPYRGLFASGVGDAEQSLTASASVASGWDDNLLAAARGENSVTVDRRAPAEGGSLGNFGGGLSYSFQRDAIAVHASATTSVRYFPSLTTRFMRGSQGQFSLTSSPRENTTFSLSASASHQPYALLSLFPASSGLSPASSDVIDLDAAISADPRLSYAGSVSASQRLSRRTTLSGSYAYRLTERSDSGSHFRHQNAGGRLTHQISSGLSVHGGYGYGEGRGNGEERFPHHNIDAGVNFNRALSFTRRTTVSFSTGSTAVRARERLRFLVTGSAQLTHEIGRSWSAWTAYGRRLQYHETWREPGLGNAVTFGLSGLVTRRLQADVAARVAMGTVGVHSDAPGFDHYYGTASLAYALARFMNVSVSYAYYQHVFDEAVPLAAGVPRSLERNSVRVAINLWAPIFQRARRTDASR
jgi:hypothetical protein